jgi:hypothetical protein
VSQKLSNAPVVDDAFDSFVSNSIGVKPAAPVPATPAMPAATPAVVHSQVINLLDMDSDFSSPPPPPVSSGPAFVLKAGMTLTPQVFQQLWAAQADTFNGKIGSMTRAMTATTEIETALRNVQINTMASGALTGPNPTDRGFKMFLFAFEDSMSNTTPFLVQLLINTMTGDISASVKSSPNPQSSSAFLDLLASVCRRF